LNFTGDGVVLPVTLAPSLTAIAGLGLLAPILVLRSIRGVLVLIVVVLDPIVDSLELLVSHRSRQLVYLLQNLAFLLGAEFISKFPKRTFRPSVKPVGGREIDKGFRIFESETNKVIEGDVTDRREGSLIDKLTIQMRTAAL